MLKHKYLFMSLILVMTVYANAVPALQLCSGTQGSQTALNNITAYFAASNTPFNKSMQIPQGSTTNVSKTKGVQIIHPVFGTPVYQCPNPPGPLPSCANSFNEPWRADPNDPSSCVCRTDLEFRVDFSGNLPPNPVLGNLALNLFLYDLNLTTTDLTNLSYFPKTQACAQTNCSQTFQSLMNQNYTGYSNELIAILKPRFSLQSVPTTFSVIAHLDIRYNGVFNFSNSLSSFVTILVPSSTSRGCVYLGPDIGPLKFQITP